MVGTVLGHYRIIELLGKGGMGEVYLAEDTRLGRRVAVKVLARELALAADGRVKVLDFGLPKLKEDALPAAAALPTQELTGEGRIVGTVAYMSPEQADAKTVDSRSDVFSLGVMLFEMATSERPFKGDTHVSLLSAILKDTPSSITDVKADLPRDFARIVKRCLHKDPEDRYQTAKDPATATETVAGKHPWRAVSHVAWLPDGKSLLINAQDAAGEATNQIWLMSVPGGEVRRITNDLSTYGGLSVAADGKSFVSIRSELRTRVWIGDATGTRGLWTMAMDGGDQRRLGTAAVGARPGLSADGKWIFYSEAGGTNRNFRIPVDGGEAVPVAVSPAAAAAHPLPDSFHEPLPSPDGQNHCRTLHRPRSARGAHRDRAGRRRRSDAVSTGADSGPVVGRWQEPPLHAGPWRRHEPLAAASHRRRAGTADPLYRRDHLRLRLVCRAQALGVRPRQLEQGRGTRVRTTVKRRCINHHLQPSSSPSSPPPAVHLPMCSCPASSAITCCCSATARCGSSAGRSRGKRSASRFATRPPAP